MDFKTCKCYHGTHRNTGNGDNPGNHIIDGNVNIQGNKVIKCTLPTTGSNNYGYEEAEQLEVAKGISVTLVTK